MDTVSPAMIEGADILLQRCGNVRAEERVVIICDYSTRDITQLLRQRAVMVTPAVQTIEIPSLRMHGEEPPVDAAQAMRRADLCIGLTKMSMAHSAARMTAAQHGVRYLSLPDYSLSLLADVSLRVNFRQQGLIARQIADAFTHGYEVVITSMAGTHLTLRIDHRIGNCCPGYVDTPGALGSPPDVESNISPLEDSAKGILVVDGSIPCPEIGLLQRPITLFLDAGRIVDIHGAADVVETLHHLLERVGSPNAYVLAECGVGLNPLAQLAGVMLIDEGVAGSMHCGFGSNATVGGQNVVPFHLDCVFRQPSMTIDGLPVLFDGVVVLNHARGEGLHAAII